MLFSCGTSSVISSSNLQKRKHRKGIFVKKKGKFKASSVKNGETVHYEVNPSEEKSIPQRQEVSTENPKDEIKDSELQEEAVEESVEEITKEEVQEILEEAHQSYLSNRALKKELKKKYPNDKKRRKEDYRMKQDKVGFAGFIIHFIGFLPIFPLIGMILGAISVARIRREKSQYTGRLKFPLWALIGGFLATLTSIGVWILINEDDFLGGIW